MPTGLQVFLFLFLLLFLFLENISASYVAAQLNLRIPAQLRIKDEIKYGDEVWR